MSVVTAYTLRATPHSTLFVAGTLGYFYHKNIQNNLHAIVALSNLFYMASITKVFTAAAVLRLHKKGLLNVDR